MKAKMTTDPRFYALDMLECAEEFFEAFRQLPPPTRRWISWPRFFLLCHSVELGLKAFLVSRGVPPTKLGPTFGHKLDPLMREARCKVIKIGVLAASELMQLDEAHKKQWARYPREEGKPVFAIETFDPYAAELLRAVSISIRGV
jgi:hypothetical protein